MDADQFLAARCTGERSYITRVRCEERQFAGGDSFLPRSLQEHASAHRVSLCDYRETFLTGTPITQPARGLVWSCAAEHCWMKNRVMR